ncbi:MAG TPA: YHS domain-containing (seleno)protein [Xanthobacteraceae bacterium]|nr:YHS domain-containing (seleno)protein [Xanthobacteraceae bacterium]
MAATAAVALLLVLPGAPRAGAATSERVVTDLLSGLAINGVDPVAYFTHAAPLYGNAEHEYRYGGTIWRFRNVGDLAAFAAHPDVYMPRYGGYDPMGLGRGVAVAGNPLVWAMVREHVYLFYDERARDRFLANPDEAIGIADEKWPAVLSTLVP